MWQATATNQQRNVLYQEHYDPYGARIIGQSTEQNTLWYTGKEHDADTGLTYLGSRWYDPRIGAAITAYDTYSTYDKAKSAFSVADRLWSSDESLHEHGKTTAIRM